MKEAVHKCCENQGTNQFPKHFQRVAKYPEAGPCDMWTFCGGMHRPIGHRRAVPVECTACTPVLLWDLADGCGMAGAAKKGRSSPERGGSPMLLERLTAWTLVVVYYTITCGAIVLGLRGAL